MYILHYIYSITWETAQFIQFYMYPDLITNTVQSLENFFNVTYKNG